MQGSHVTSMRDDTVGAEEKQQLPLKVQTAANEFHPCHRFVYDGEIYFFVLMRHLYGSQARGSAFYRQR